MKNKILRAIGIFAVTVALTFSFAACDEQKKENYPEPTERFFVNDFAGVMTEEDMNTVYTKGAALNEQTTAQAVIVTVESLDGKAAADYALELGRQWGVGDSEKDNGIVILFSEQDREIYIAVGYGLEGALPDSKTGRIIDAYGIPYFSSDEFSTGLVNIYNSIVNEIYIEYGITPDENYTPIAFLPQSDADEEISLAKVALSWLVLIVIVSLYVAIFGRRGGLFIFGGPRFFGGNFNNHGGFGGSSGGFGGFSGGGGSFGGGGAGRKF